MTDDPTPNDIDAIAEQINQDTKWTVEDWDYSVGKFDQPTLEIELEWNPLSELHPQTQSDLGKEILDVIERRDTGDGAAVSSLTDEILERMPDLTAANVTQEIENLKQDGEIYMHTEGRLRRT